MEDTVQDLLQETMTSLWVKRDSLNKHPNPKAYILKIAISRAVDHLRKEGAQKRTEPETHSTDYGADTNEAELCELRAIIVEEISALPPSQSEAMLLRCIEELPYREIAETMGCSEATIRTHVRRGRMKLNSRLQSMGIEWSK